MSGVPRRVVYLDLDGTLLGPGGSMLRNADGRFSVASVRALELLHGAGVPIVLVSGRSRPRLEAVASLLGAAGVLPEMGATDAGYPTAPGQTVHEAIEASGVPAALREAEPGLAPHPLAAWGREGSHVMLGRAGPDAPALVERLSRGALRLADNGEIGTDGAHVYHLLPAGASKAAAVERDVAARGADPAACLAVGDSRQDLDVGRVVGAVAIVANGAAADPEIAARAAWVTRGAYGEGVLEAVEAWLGGATGA
ncbi:HAD family hydrolase [Miltoncostaea marina]|uniref:HAD family hydrolase n=1 Tax=Miltoncostaea marina TaxID=2843215 RepID=UPI001C3CB04D|nr:HAD family hydrolase [Miltoncostaea marina]